MGQKVCHQHDFVLLGVSGKTLIDWCGLDASFPDLIGGTASQTCNCLAEHAFSVFQMYCILCGELLIMQQS